jgi:flagellar biosynthesis protein FlhB
VRRVSPAPKCTAFTLLIELKLRRGLANNSRAHAARPPMADSDSQNRNLPASQRKLDKARADGQVPRSRDLGHFAALAAGVAALAAAAPTLAGWLQQMLARALKLSAGAARDPALMVERLGELAQVLLWVALPAGLLMSAVAVAANLGLGGWNWTWKPLQPKFGKLNPLTGVTRLFAKAQLIDALKACALALILGVIAALYLHGRLDSFVGLLALPLPGALRHAGQTALGGLLLLVIALALFAAIDAPLQRTLHALRLKMSMQEARQELKETEGSPDVKARVKARMREIGNRRMLAAVPGADLVVMNPTHYAVALKYDESRMRAPRVVAKGADLMALRIRDSARNADVPVLQAPVLARALYAHSEIDQEVPAALFAAVAQVLAYVYQLRAALAGGGAMPGEMPALDIPAELDPHAPRHPAGDAAPDRAAPRKDPE